MGESAAVDVVSEVEFEAIAKVVRDILPKRTMLVDSDGLTINIEESGMVDCGARQQAEQLNRLNGKQDDDAPDGTGRKIADGDEHQAVNGIEHQDVAIVKGYVDQSENEQQTHAPCETGGEIVMFLLLIVVHDEETQSEQHGKDAIHLPREEPGKHIGNRLVARKGVRNRFVGKDVEVLNRMIENDASHSNTSQSICHFDSHVGYVTGGIHRLRYGHYFTKIFLPSEI